MSDAAATFDQAAHSGQLDSILKDNKSSVDMGVLLQFMRDSIKRLGAAAGNAIAWLLKQLRRVCNRVAQLLGAEVTYRNNKGQEIQAEGEELAEGLQAEFSGAQAEQAAKLVKEIVDLQAENFEAIAPALDLLGADNGEEFLKAALKSLMERLHSLQQEHTEIIQLNEPMMDAVCASLNVASYEQAYDLLTDEATPFAGPPVDPHGEFRVVHDRIARIEDEIKKANHAIRSYCAAALEMDALRPIAVEFLSQPHMAEIKKTIEPSLFTGKVDGLGEKSIARGIESRNNLGAGEKVVDLTAAALAKSRARELPAESTPQVPASEKAPLGVSRFAAVNKLRHGDLEGSNDVSSESSERLVSPKT